MFKVFTDDQEFITYETETEAIKAVRQHTSASYWVESCDGGTTYYYHSQADADADPEGSFPVAAIIDID